MLVYVYLSHPARDVLARAALMAGQSSEPFEANPIGVEEQWYQRLVQAAHDWQLSPSDYLVALERYDAES